jgi:hypothetical protein
MQGVAIMENIGAKFEMVVAAQPTDGLMDLV